MLPFKTLIALDKTASQPVYGQLSEQLGQLIRAGTLPAGTRLPGTRQLAQLLDLHRQTVVAAYDDLLAQGWLESRPNSGTFVAAHLPEIQPQKLATGAERKQSQTKTGFAFERSPELVRPVLHSPAGLRFDDGFPDARLAPLDELGRAYRSYFKWGNPQAHVGYGDVKGHLLLREELSKHLNETRGLRTTPDNLLITRGSIMGLYLTSQVLLRPGRGTAGDRVVTGDTTWAGATMNIRKAGATLLTVPVDNHGMDVDALAQLCEKQAVRLVYVTPHHHYPTTVTLRADRRVRLLQLAEQHGFAILEDDYDYDYHYLSRPILPLASADRQGMVVYVGSLTKSVAPAFRVGYVVAPTELITELASFRRIIDRHVVRHHPQPRQSVAKQHPIRVCLKHGSRIGAGSGGIEEGNLNKATRHESLFMVKPAAAPAIPMSRRALKAFFVHFFNAFEVVAGEPGAAKAHPHKYAEGHNPQQNIHFDG